MTKRDLISTEDLSDEEVVNLLELADRIRGRGPKEVLKGKTLGLLLRAPSLRTRVSFEVAMFQLGGHSVPLDKGELYDFEAREATVMDGTAEEHVRDAAMTLSAYLDGIGIRDCRRGQDWAEDRKDLLLHHYAQHASAPVINLGSHMEHPCQALADLQTMRSKVRTLRGRKLTLAWTPSPDPQGFGATHSLLRLASRFGMRITLAHPQGYELDDEILASASEAAERSGGSLRIAHDLADASRDSDFLHARAWPSLKHYADPDRERLMQRSLEHWQITQELLEAGQRSWLLHPLPVRRNFAVADAALDGPCSLVRHQVEMRLHVQKALLVQLLI